VLARDRFRCHWCGRRATTVDHLVPRALGGSDYDLDNLVAACADCNSRRGGELAQALGGLGQHPVRGRRIVHGAIGGGTYGTHHEATQRPAT